MRPSRRNPLVFDNRFDPKAVRRSGSRVVASLVAPPAQRAQVERLADSPHTFRVVLVDEASDYYDNEGLATLSQPGPTRPKLVVGFAAETENLIENAQAKRAKKKCDWVVANDVSPGSGAFGGDSNTVHLVTADGVESWPTLRKRAVAERLAERIAASFQRQ